ncbi:uncharacterized protein LOC128678898 [Plodia interpunctella]|uniref:uncharacterized protein LOC128678898 n=1 Tax=Plodia interpunctella TaxID=58824 RepID=UPI0023678619|nr:uncharacterized protein LOC128678898 [Plodia interpunctella]
MGIENMRRWPMYVLFALCILLFLSLFNSWSMETEMRTKMSEMSAQIQECSKQQTSCVADSLTLMEQRNSYVEKVKNLEKSKDNLADDVISAKNKLKNVEEKVNSTRADLQLCKTELQSFKNLQITMAATIETLRLENSQLVEKKQKIVELEKEIERLKSALTTKAAPLPPMKITPAAQPMKQSPALDNNNNLAEKPQLENKKVAEQAPIESNNAIEHPALDSNDHADRNKDNNDVVLEDNNANEELDTNMNDQEVDPQFQ